MTVSEFKILVDKYAELNPNAEVLIEYIKANSFKDRETFKVNQERTFGVRTINDFVINGNKPILIENGKVTDVIRKVKKELYHFKQIHQRNYKCDPSISDIAKKQKAVEQSIKDSKFFVEEYLVIR